MADYFDLATTPANAYEVRVEKPGDDLVWMTEENGKPVRIKHEPESGLRRRAKVLITRMLPVDNLL